MRQIPQKNHTITNKRKFFIQTIVFGLFLSSCTGPVQKIPQETHSQPIVDLEKINPEKQVDTGASKTPEIQSTKILKFIGYSKIPSPSYKAQKINKKSLRFHRAKNFKKARQGFDQALKLSQGNFPIARYNLACALSRLGMLEESTTQIKKLLEKDFPRFNLRIKEDEDFKNLRESPYWMDIQEYAKSLRPSWHKAMDLGVPAVIQRVFDEYDNVQDVFRFLRWTQAGLYIHEWSRFVPMAPPVYAPEADQMVTPLTSSFFDRVNKRVIAISGIGANADDAHLSYLSILAYESPAGKSLLKEFIGRGMPEFEARSTEEGIQVRTKIFDKRYKWQTWKTIVHTPIVSNRKNANLIHFWGDQYGIWIAQKKQKDTKLRGNKLTVGKKSFSLHSKHRKCNFSSVIYSKDRSSIAVSSWSYLSEMDYGYSDLNVTDFIDLKTEKVINIALGRDTGAALIGADEAYYLQIGMELRRYASFKSADYEKIMPGVLLQAFPLKNPYSKRR